MSLFNPPSTNGTTPPPAVGEGPNSAIVGIHAAYGLLALAWICVGLKFSLKFVYERHLWKYHDLFTALGLIFATAEVIVIGIDIQVYGEGQHITTIPTQNLNMVFRLVDHRYIMYELALMFIKLSILHFYLTIFSVKRLFRNTVYFMMAFVVVYLTIFIFIDTFRCSPLKKMWYPYSVPGHCLNGVAEERAFGVFNSVTDTVILVMPFPVLLSLNMSRKRLMPIILIFGLGAFTCAAAITRTVIIWDTLSSKDATWSVGPEITWMNVEMLVGLICCALLSAQTLVRHFFTETRVGRSIISLLSRRSPSSRESGSETSQRRRQGERPRYRNWDDTEALESTKASFRPSLQLNDFTSHSHAAIVGHAEKPEGSFSEDDINVSKTVDLKIEDAV